LAEQCLNRTYERTPQQRTAEQHMKAARQRENASTAAERRVVEVETGTVSTPAFAKLHEYFNVVDNTINDQMHLFYNVILLIFSYIIRDKFNTQRRQQFLAEGRSFVETFMDGRRKVEEWTRNDAAFFVKCGPPARAGWQASNNCLQHIINTRHLRPVPGNEAGDLDCPFRMNSDGPTLSIDSTAQWLRLIGPIGVYYIFRCDLHPEYQQAFAHTLWWIFKLRRRYTVKNMLRVRVSDSESVDEDEDVIEDEDEDEDDNNGVTSDTYDLETYGRERLAVLEYLMPRHFCTIVMHLMQHACKTLRLAGPPHGHWMFPFERWIKMPKGRLHSGKGAAESIMKSQLEHEWLVQRQASTQAQLNSLLQPPPSHFPDAREVMPVGRSRTTPLLCVNDPNRHCDYHLIFQFLIQNDPVMKVLNTEFEKVHPEYKQAKIYFENWQPHILSLNVVLPQLRQLCNDATINADDVRIIIRGPSPQVQEYQRFSVNGVVFCTRAHEGARKRCTRRFVYYRFHGAVDSNGVVCDEVVAQVERIYSVMSSSCLKTGKRYTLLRVTNYKYTPTPHPSELPQVKPIGMTKNVFAKHSMPVIDAKDVRPIYIACWPAGADAANTYLVVQSDTVDD
jgi:hypothetical protein